MTDRAPSSIPGPDPLVTATGWLNSLSDCDLDCKQNHPVAHSTVSGLHAAAATARIAAKDAQRERDALQARIDATSRWLREMADATSYAPHADLLRYLAGEAPS